MNLQRPKTLIAALLCFLCTTNASARPRFGGKQYTELSKFWQTFYSGLNYNFSNIYIDYKRTSINQYGRPETEKLYAKMKYCDWKGWSPPNMGGTAGFYFPIDKVGKASILALGVEGYINTDAWSYSDETVITYNYSTGMYEEHNYITAGIVSYGFPLTIEYKTGGEAMLSQKYPLSFTLGGGVVPTKSETVFFGLERTSKWNLRPIFKIEFGATGVFCWKFRATYQAGNILHSTFTDKGENYEETLSFIGKGRLFLTFTIMETAAFWEKKDKWY